MSEPRHILFSNYEAKTYQYMGFRYNNDLITYNTGLMQDSGMSVLCQSIEKEPMKNEALLKGYLWDDNLYENSLLELEAKTGSIAKRW